MKRLSIIFLMFSVPSISFAQVYYASTDEFFVDLTFELLELQWGYEDPEPSFNPFDSLEVVKSQTEQIMKEIGSPFENEQYKSSKIIMETLFRLDYRISMIELSIKAIEDRLKLAEIKN